ncbi:MAG TPA: aminotransferase class IV [Solirubrobacteraceae bacterium]|nr:aminotransferase class IV [Solirubrobacteraceae bacterium]
MPSYEKCVASLNGEIMPAPQAMIPVTDEGLLRGDGVFEAVRVYDGVPFRLEEHLLRLERSARNLRLPLDLEAVRGEVRQLLSRAGSGEDRPEAVRIVVTRGGRRIVLTEELPKLPERIRLGSIAYAPTRVLDGVKSLSYAANMLARRLAEEAGFDEALLVTPHGRVLEATTSSVFWVKAGRLYTPPLSDHILASITRALVLDVTDAEERESTLEDVLDAEEVFLASTMREVHPVAALDAREYGAETPVTDAAADAVSRRLADELAQA